MRGKRYWETKGSATYAANRANPEWLEREKIRGVARRYGMTVETFLALLASQGGKCAACGDELVLGLKTHVDHDHDTGLVRALLCRGCNLAEGLLQGSAMRARKLAAYIEKHAPRLFT